MKQSLVASITAISLFADVFARELTIENNCPFTIWPALFTTPGLPTPSQATGWTQAAFESLSFGVPDTWGGRIWARRDCNFDVPNPGPNSCLDGGCIGGLVCDPKIGTGVPPATLAEFTLTTSTDNYDANSPSCCTGTFDNPSTCVSSGVQYYSYFKGNCPNSVVYAFDQPAQYTCSGLPNYTIIFCP
ncbi:thaumatin [Cubamyces menziesii]|nr:thaumatin [Cubamyces menziesii]